MEPCKKPLKNLPKLIQVACILHNLEIDYSGKTFFSGPWDELVKPSNHFLVLYYLNIDVSDL